MELFEDALERVRLRYLFAVAGYVVMPEHVHLLINEPQRALLSKAIQALKLSVSMRSRERPFWQAHYYDFNVFARQVCREVALHSSEPGAPRAGRDAGRLAVVELSPLSNGCTRTSGD